MSKKLKIVKLLSITTLCFAYIIGLLVAPFKLTLASKEVVKVSVLSPELAKYFSGLKAFLIVLLAILAIVFVMFVICLIGEFTKRPNDNDKKFLRAFGYFLEDKEIRQFSYVLSVILVVTMLVSGATYKGNTLLEVKLSAKTTTFLILSILTAINLIITHLGVKKKTKKELFE